MIRIIFILLLFTFFAYLASGQSNAGNEAVQVETSKELYIIHVKLIDKTGASVAGKRSYVTNQGHPFEMRTAVSDSLGNLVFLLKDIEGSKQLIFQTNTNTDSTISFEFENPLSKRFVQPRIPEAEQWPADTLPFYGKAEKEYFLDDYTRFHTMEEVLREYIPEVRVLRKSGDQFHFSVLDFAYKSYFDNDPLVLLDGVPVFNINLLMALDPLKIRSIQIVPRKYYYGSLVCNGIVSFFSYQGDLAGYTLPRQAEVRDIGERNLSK